MATVTKDELFKIADRAMIELTDEEATQFAEEISAFMEYANKLNELDTEGVAPMTHALQQANVMREDLVANVLDRDIMLESVKEHQDGQIKVPTILSE